MLPQSLKSRRSAATPREPDWRVWKRAAEIPTDLEGNTTQKHKQKQDRLGHNCHKTHKKSQRNKSKRSWNKLIISGWVDKVVVGEYLLMEYVFVHFKQQKFDLFFHFKSCVLLYFRCTNTSIMDFNELIPRPFDYFLMTFCSEWRVHSRHEPERRRCRRKVYLIKTLMNYSKVFVLYTV